MVHVGLALFFTVMLAYVQALMFGASFNVFLYSSLVAGPDCLFCIPPYGFYVMY